MEDYEFVTFVQQANHEMAMAVRKLQEQVGRFDLIHAHDWLTRSAAVTLKHRWRIPLIATIHATERGRGRGTLASTHAERVNRVEWELTFEAWRLIVCSEFMANELVAYFGAPRNKIDVVPNGVVLHGDPFPTAEDRLAYRRRIVPDATPLAYYVGRVVYEKGLGVLLAAWPQVLTRHPARLIIAGAGGYLDSLKTQAWELGITDSVIFTGFISDVDRDRLYHAADVAVFPSLYEAFGIVALEAMAACCPVVVSATGGLAEVVRPHETGITVPPDDPAALAWGICHTLDRPDWARTRAENALRDVEQHYTWPLIAHTTIAVYERVIGEWLMGEWGHDLALG
jgi:glycosyltransferase involved in cell wall biosynthesis